ncbi:hypothetical protein MFIFM68171_00159 [Madurella fahalii]|uniref:Uncharacterized protein n=1 Tax=Madurella fahalii TaxID=1157608 RepID=A0ABQ0FWR9_9PEZI
MRGWRRQAAVSGTSVFFCREVSLSNVLETGDGCKELKAGDYIFGCVRIGQNRLSPFQETFLVEEDLVFKKNAKTTPQEACTMGVGFWAASGAWTLDMTLPEPGAAVDEKSSWVIVIGGSGNVGQDQKITQGNFGRVFDASAYAAELSLKGLQACSTEEKRYFSTVDDWSDINAPSSIVVYLVQLGLIGRFDDLSGAQVSSRVADWIPGLERCVDSGCLRPLQYHEVEGVGWDKVIDAIAGMETGKSLKKPVARVQDW